MFLIPQLSSAQIEDLIEEQIKDYITKEAEGYIDIKPPLPDDRVYDRPHNGD
jgi:hypothetical protein